MKKSTLTIATRKSPLALWQANWVKMHLEHLYPNLNIHLLGLTTQADKLLTVPLYEVGGKGLFVKELEEALFQGKADLAVHSMKDVPMELPQGLCIPVMCQREDPRDVFVSNHFSHWEKLPQGVVVGTSSLRRQSQLLALRPDLKVVHLRGNIHTRLKKLDDEEYSAIILAAAGLKRLNLEARIQSFFSLEDLLPAPGQGVLGLECREDDEETKALISPLNHMETMTCVLAERALCRYLGGGCQVPLAAYAELNLLTFELKGLVAKEDGTLFLRSTLTGDSENPEELGTRVAQALLNQGAEEILKCHHPKKN